MKKNKMAEPTASVDGSGKVEFYKEGMCHTRGCNNKAVMAKGDGIVIHTQLCQECYDKMISDRNERYTKSEDIKENIMQVIGEGLIRHVFARACLNAVDNAEARGDKELVSRIWKIEDGLRYNSMSLEDVPKDIMYEVLPHVNKWCQFAVNGWCD